MFGARTKVTLTPQNAAQILQNPGAVLVQVGDLGPAAKKIERLRVAAGGRLPLCHLSCQALPQICQALQIKSSPCLLLMARGQAPRRAKCGRLFPPVCESARMEQDSALEGCHASVGSRPPPSHHLHSAIFWP